MEHLYQKLNTKALDDVLNLVFGTQMTEVIGKLYALVDQSTRAGYELGLIDGEQRKEEGQDIAFDSGYDNGYVDGVGDARARPVLADQNVVEIVSDAAQFALNGEYDASNVADSGDETEERHCPECGAEGYLG